MAARVRRIIPTSIRTVSVFHSAQYRFFLIRTIRIWGAPPWFLFELIFKSIFARFVRGVASDVHDWAILIEPLALTGLESVPFRNAVKAFL